MSVHLTIRKSDRPYYPWTVQLTDEGNVWSTQVKNGQDAIEVVRTALDQGLFSGYELLSFRDRDAITRGYRLPE